MVHDRLLDPAHLAPYATLVLPNLAALSDAQCDQLRAFVKNGGNLIATCETSLYNEWGVRRSNFGLADLFGVDWTRKAEGPMLNSYIRLEHEALPHHLFFSGLEDAPRSFPATLICLWKKYIHGRRRLTSLAFFFVKPRVAWRTFPGTSTGPFGRCYAPITSSCCATLFANVEAPVVEVHGPGLLDVAVWENAGSITVHLVNLTNPMAMKGQYRDSFPVGAQTIKLRLPGGVHANHVPLLVADRNVPFELSGSVLTLPVPSILDHEVVAIDI
jgi:hypothetical protein